MQPITLSSVAFQQNSILLNHNLNFWISRCIWTIIFSLEDKKAKESSSLNKNETWSQEGPECKTCALRAQFWRFSDFKRKVSNFGYVFFLFQMLNKVKKASTCLSPMRTGSVTLYQLSSSNNTVGWLRPLV